jgi:glycosyltransferase involved in cell wall biosynthesis/putative flippase GtrA
MPPGPRHAWERPEVRFLAVGGGSALLNLGLLWVLVGLLALPYLVACTISFFALNGLGYLLNKSVTFRRGREVRWHELWRYFAVMAASLAANLALMALLVGQAGLPYLGASVVVTIVLAAVNFIAHRGLTFADRPAAAPDDSPCALRVLQVSAFFPAHGGGIEVVAGQLARRLAASGVPVVWMAGGAESERPAGAPRLVVDRAGSVDFIERRLGLPAPIWNPAALRRLWRHLGACDVVHVHDYLYFSSLMAMLFAALRGRPVVLTQHIGDIAFESPVARAVLRTLNRTLGRLVLGRAAQVVFVGKPVMAHFEAFVRFRRPPMLLSNGVDHDLYRPAREAPARPADAPLEALFVGRFVEKKGLALLRECASLPGVHWTFVGRGPLSPAEWGLPADALRLPGVLPPQAVADAMRAADVLVLPSKGEGFPLVLQEALACGTPVLTSREVAEAFPEIDPRCVMDVDVADPAPPGPVARLRAAIEALARDPGRVRDAREAAAALAAQWSWDRCVEAYIHLYRVIGATGRPSTE